MSSVAKSLQEGSWKDRLGLTHRRAPELYESSKTVVDVPHAPAIRAALDDMGLTAIFCVQGVPTVAILAADTYDRDTVVNLHGALWNQGLASLLLVIADDTLRVFSLARTPLRDPGEAFESRCLIETLQATTEALRFRNLIYGAESGRLWREHAEYFPLKERIDQVLLDNLKVSHELLQAQSLSSDAAQALLIQAMFIAYLEDREIVSGSYFQALSDSRVDSFSSLLEAGDVNLLRALFVTLQEDFNGDLFVAPCSFETQAEPPNIVAEHLMILARFRSGREEMASSGQQRFWGYDFRYIPIELVSAVYDRFLGEREDERRANGAFYTPMFLADTVVSQAWELLSDRVKSKGSFLDPACGSGVFLVRSFQRLCEHWRGTHKSTSIPWKTLLSLLSQIHGWDVNRSAVRVAVFSLYVGLLEEVSPRDIRKLISRGKILPDLWNKTLTSQDFFAVSPEIAKFDVIIGNPPWTSRRGRDRSSIKWSKSNSRPMPGGEDAWAFSWKALSHIAPDGLIAFLLPSMGFLHNHAAPAVQARNDLLRSCHVRRVINFADLRFQLFEKAHRPAALLLYSPLQVNEFPYRFEYWAPKADLNLRIKRVITLSAADKVVLSVAAALENPLVFKQRLWMREPDAKLFSYLSRLPKLGDLVTDFGSISRRKANVPEGWIIGQGYQPLHTTEEGVGFVSKFVGHLPDLPIGAFTRLAQSADGLRPAPSNRVRRRGFEVGFEGVRVLVPRGVETAQSRLRASFSDEPLTFQHILQGISVPAGNTERAKLLTALLNSRVAIWYAFHGTASFGSDRPEVQQADLLKLPFPSPEDLPNKEAAADAAHKLVRIIEHALLQTGDLLAQVPDHNDVLLKIDRLAYQYFGLSIDEVAIIEDTVDAIIPALQPHEGQTPTLWLEPNEIERSAYAEFLTKSLNDWFDGKGSISARLVAKSADLGVLRLRLNGQEEYSESVDGQLSQVLEELSDHIHQPLDGNFQLMPDLRVFVGESLFLIKPMQRRFWLRAAALADADSIALDLQQAVSTKQRGSAN